MALMGSDVSMASVFDVVDIADVNVADMMMYGLTMTLITTTVIIMTTITTMKILFKEGVSQNGIPLCRASD